MFTIKLASFIIAVIVSIYYPVVNVVTAFAPPTATIATTALFPTCCGGSLLASTNYKCDPKRYTLLKANMNIDNELVMSSSPVTSSLLLSQNTFDPTTILSDVFGTVLGTPLILAIPIVAALSVATLIAYLIVSYASPAEEE